MLAPALADPFDPSGTHPVDVTMARLLVIDPESHAAIKLIAEHALRKAWARTLGRRSEPPSP